MKRAPILLLLSLLFIVAACDLFDEDNPDESNDPQSELIGTWDYPWIPSEYQRTQYLVFQPGIVHYLSNSETNFHSQTAQFYAVDDHSLTIGSSLNRFGVEDDGNLLWLSDQPGDTLFLERSAAEINPDQWLADLTLEAKVPLILQDRYWSGFASDGEVFVIMVDTDTLLQLQKFSPQGDSLDIEAWQLPANFTFYDGYLWFHWDSILYRVDPETWEYTPTVTLADRVDNLTAMTMDETTIWGSVYGSLRCYDRASGALIDTLATPSRTMWSLALHQGRLFSVFGGTLLEFDTEEGQVSTTYDHPDEPELHFYGLASDETYLYSMNVKSDGLDLVTLRLPE